MRDITRTHSSWCCAGIDSTKLSINFIISAPELLGLDDADDLGLKDDLGVFTRAGGVWRSLFERGGFLGVLEGGGGSSRLLPMAPKTAMGFRERAIVAAPCPGLGLCPRSRRSGCAAARLGAMLVCR